MATLRKGRLICKPPGRSCSSVPHPFGQYRNLASRRVGSPSALRKIFPDSKAELGFSGSHCIMFSGRAVSSSPLLTTAEIFTTPFLVRSSGTCPRIMSLSSSHSDPRTVPRLSRHPRRLEHCWQFRDMRVTTVYECITQSWWRAHQTRIAATVPQQECLVVLFGPTAIFSGLFSLRRVLLQVVNPSFTGAQPRKVPNSFAHVARDAFSFAFGLPYTPAFALAFPLGFSMGSCGHS